MSKNRTVAGPDALRASPPTVRAVLTRRRLLVALPLASALVAALVWLPVASWTSQAVVWIRGAGAPGVAAYALLYVVATVVLAPGSVLTLGAGFAYGPLWGTLLVWPVSTLAATAAFVIARTFGRGWVEVVAPDGSQVWVDGRAQGGVPLKLLSLLEGYHQVEVVFPDKSRSGARVEVVTGMTQSHEALWKREQ